MEPVQEAYIDTPQPKEAQSSERPIRVSGQYVRKTLDQRDKRLHVKSHVDFPFRDAEMEMNYVIEMQNYFKSHDAAQRKQGHLPIFVPRKVKADQVMVVCDFNTNLAQMKKSND